MRASSTPYHKSTKGALQIFSKAVVYHRQCSRKVSRSRRTFSKAANFPKSKASLTHQGNTAWSRGVCVCFQTHTAGQGVPCLGEEDVCLSETLLASKWILYKLWIMQSWTMWRLDWQRRQPAYQISLDSTSHKRD